MRVLIVARCKNGKYAPFISEQVEALKKQSIECMYFSVNKGGYFKQLPEFKKAIRKFKPDIIHAHYGLCGLFSTFQSKIPVVTTYHGSDINAKTILPLSRLAIRRSTFNIFVSKKCIDIAKPKEDFALIPCGINIEDYPTISKSEARTKMGLKENQKYILFAGAFDNPIKNAQLAIDVVSNIDNSELIELKGYSRQEVVTLMFAVDALLMTSLSEGSPQVIKEALACGCPIVSVDVGDVKEMISGIEGCYISDHTKERIYQNLINAIAYKGRTQGASTILEKKLDNQIIAKNIISIYSSIISHRKR